MSAENTKPAEEASNPEVIYISENIPNFKIGKIKFQNCKFVTSDPARIRELDLLIATRPDISSVVRRVDPAAARKMAEEHMKRVAMQQRAVKGAFSSADLRSLQHAALDDRDTKLRAQGVDPEKLDSDVIKNADLALSHRAMPASTPDVGFIPKPPQSAQQTSTPKAPADIPLQTGKETLPTTSGDQAQGAPAKINLTPKQG